MICSQDGQPTAYSLNAEYELLENGKPLFVRQRRAIVGKTLVRTKKTDIKVPMHLFYADSLFQAEKTSYLFLRYSDDQAKPGQAPFPLMQW